METPRLKKAGILTLVLVLASIGSWELYLRSHGNKISYDDGEPLWNDKRTMVYEPIDKATVFIGASRNKYDIDIDTWQKVTGDHVIQLALEGDSPLPVLDDLAKDKKFKGKLIVDVTEGIFFSTTDNNIGESKEFVSEYKKRTPAQRFSFQINHFLESKLVFLDKNYFSLNSILQKLKVSKRKGVIAEPFEYPLEAGRITFDRQNIMMNEFLIDTVLRNHVIAIWDYYLNKNKEIPPLGKKLDSIFTTIKYDCDQIKGRGGKILFVRTPSSGMYLTREKKQYPREIYWNKLLTYTNTPGIHFEDYPAIANLQCPENSHLARPDAIVFTKNLIEILRLEKGWNFPQNHITTLNNSKISNHGF